MNPRQRRGALLVAFAGIGAVAVFVVLTRYVADVQTQLGPMQQVLELQRPVAAFEPVAPDVLATVEVPARWVPDGTLSSAGEIGDQVAASDLRPGAFLHAGMLQPRPELTEGQREIAIMVDAETGVAGKIGPGSLVDIYATFPGTDGVDPPFSSIVIERARILAVGGPETEVAQDGFTENEVVPVTFALSVEESLRLAYIESFATKVRLALRAPTDDDPLELGDRTYRPQLTGGGG